VDITPSFMPLLLNIVFADGSAKSFWKTFGDLIIAHDSPDNLFLPSNISLTALTSKEKNAETNLWFLRPNNYGYDALS
jgi:prepilin-type processing-associated H-X9-DG protein